VAALANMPTTVHISGGFVYMLHFAPYVPDVGRYQAYKDGIERYMDEWHCRKIAGADG
jgi:hypothetical protein